MFVLNFKKQFVPAIESGAKKQTIRAIRKDGRQPKIGDMLRLYTGMRTKYCRWIADAICTDVDPVKIDNAGVYLNGLPPHPSQFAHADGFESFDDMRAWFGKTPGLPFEGILIRWQLTIAGVWTAEG